MSGLCEGRIAIVTGAGRGIGREHALSLARHGAKVVVNDLGGNVDGTGGDLSPADQVVQEIKGMGGEAVANGDDISSWEGAQRLINTAVETFGDLHALVNNAGILRDRMLTNMTEEEWDAVIRVHLKGHYNLIKPAAAHWRQVGDAEAQNRIINFTSRAGLHGAPGQANYSSAKLGIVGLTYSCAVALRRYGVTTNAVSPAAATRMTATAGKSGVDGLDEAELSPDNIAPVVAWLASEQSGWCNGQVIHSRGYELNLYSKPEPISTVHSDGPWDLAQLGKEVEAAFRPIVEAQPPNPFA
jgi:NAD(P)-dependent dehydrogenase (short-subunit alcohol dehydrogenase family)